MGVSVGGYAIILFGSLCNINNVIAYISITMFQNRMINSKYFNLKYIINNKTKYILYGNTNIKDENDCHHISQCNNLNNFTNINIIYKNGLNMKELRDNGIIKNDIDKILVNFN